MKLHEKIYRLRTEKKMSQGDLAEILDVSRQSVSKWETGASVPDLDKLVKMSDLFGVTIDFLVREEIDPVAVHTRQAEEGEREEDEIPPQNTVIIKETLPLRKIFGALLFVSAFIFLFIAWPLSVFAAALGVICLAVRKHTLLWCAWFTYFAMDIYMITGTAIRRAAVFSPYAYGVWGIRILVHWSYLLLLLALIAWTVYTFRLVRYDLTPRRNFGFALGWTLVLSVLPLGNFILSQRIAKKITALIKAAGGVLTVGSEIYEQHRFYVGLMSTAGFVFEWIQIIALTVLLILTVSRIRMYRERKNG